MRRTFRFEDVAEALPELATDVDEVRGVEDLRVHSSVRVEIVVGVVVRIHAARFVLHAQRLDDFFDIVNGFRVFFQIFFLRLRLTTGLESRKKAYKKEKFFYKKSLTTCAGPRYNGVSQGDTPTPPPPPGGGEQIACQEVGTLLAAVLLYYYSTLVP